MDPHQLQHELYFLGQSCEAPAQNVDGRAVIGLPRVQAGQVEIGLEIVRRQRDSSLVERHGRGQTLLAQVDVAQHVVRLSQGAVECNCLPERGNRLS